MVRLFQIVLVGSNLIPLATGLLAVAMGASLFVSDEHITTDFDAQIRVYGIWFTANFALCLWAAFNLKTCGPIIRIVFSLMAVAGVLRVYTMVTAGDFPTTTLVGSVVEIALLGFIPWHNHILKRLSDASLSGPPLS